MWGRERLATRAERLQGRRNRFRFDLPYWSAGLVSGLGSEVTGLALPLTGVLVLAATPSEMGLLSAARTAPFLFFGFLAGWHLGG